MQRKSRARDFHPTVSSLQSSIAVAVVATVAVFPREPFGDAGGAAHPPQQSLWRSEVDNYQLFYTEWFAF